MQLLKIENNLHQATNRHCSTQGHVFEGNGMLVRFICLMHSTELLVLSKILSLQNGMELRLMEYLKLLPPNRHEILREFIHL